jgi:alpha-tubulin suppressor-like RCC1 family protein
MCVVDKRLGLSESDTVTLVFSGLSAYCAVPQACGEPFSAQDCSGIVRSVSHGLCDGAFIAPNRVRVNCVQIEMSSCALNSSLCFQASGSIITFGGNEVGQCGHSQTTTKAVPPRLTQGLGSKICTRVACGYVLFKAHLTLAASDENYSRELFSVALTSDGEVYSWGVGDCTGHANAKDTNTAERVAGLAALPVKHISAAASQVGV